MRKIRHLRWWIAVLLFGAAVLNYVDRQTLSALAPTVQRDLGMDDRDYANIVNIFLVAYTIAYLVSGRITDRLGTRAGMVLFVVWWSIANALTAAAQGVRSLGAFRFALGLGEAGVWPAASKAVSEWFPASERALAIGFYTMGATIGATMAPYIVIALAEFPYAEKLPFLAQTLGEGAGWRIAFILTGLAGFVWLIPWLLLYRSPQESRFIGEKERALIAAGESSAADNNGTPWTWKQVFTSRIVWLLLFARLITDPVWYFYQFWFPKYLNAERGLEQGQLTVTWIVYAAAGVGSLVGGWASGALIKRGAAPVTSRLWIMLGCAALMPLSAAIAHVAGIESTLLLTGIVIFGALAWLINLSSIINDLVPRHSLGTAFSVIATGSTVGGIVMNVIVATLVSGPATKPGGFLDHALQTVFGGLLSLVEGRGYGAWFLAMAFLHPVAFAIIWFGGIHRTARSA